MSISEVTVKSHIGHIFVKLNLRDPAAAIVFATAGRGAEPGIRRATVSAGGFDSGDSLEQVSRSGWLSPCWA